MSELTRGQKAAETRSNNTKAEVEFLAKTFFEFAQFSISSGITNTATISNNFEGMIVNYVQLGKIKQESYNKFKSFMMNSNISLRGTTKDKFISDVVKGFEGSLMNNFGDGMMESLRGDFFTLLQKYNITMPTEVKQALFIEFGTSLSKLYRDENMKQYFKSLAERLSSTTIEFNGPRVVTRESDGCSGSRTIYGSLWDNLDKLRR